MSVLDDLEFIFFHLMPYAPLPDGYKEADSLWVDYPNSNFDPVAGHELYKRYWSELLLADQLGYDGVFVNEHHNTQFTMNAAPNLTAAAIIPHTSCRIGVFGTPPNFEYPNRLAEEYAMLDVMSGGRLEVAFPLGTGMEYWANSVNPATARARFRDGLDVIFQAWTQPGPTSYSGDFYNYRYLNPWPTPYQKPHPPAYVVGSGSEETVELAAELGLGYSVAFRTRRYDTRCAG
jgi:alkanesulfonate monooxygenase SsuD/methylene tetrahydromethanopterin reductase-like flavin-dependent oxidoreductase (luciferase family)